jgi:hypothetical protein
LIFVIGVFAYLETAGVARAGRIAIEGEVSTKSSLPYLSVPIIILNGADAVEYRFSRAQGLDLVRSERSPVVIEYGNGSSDADRYFTIGLPFRDLFFIIGWPLWQSSNRGDDADHKIASTYPAIASSGIYNIEPKHKWLIGPQIRLESISVCGCEPNMFQTHFGAVRRIKFVSSQSYLSAVGAVEADSSDPHSDICKNQPQSECGNRITGRQLPKGFAFACVVAGLCGGLVTGFFLLRSGDE